jgi:hypothetical protein
MTWRQLHVAISPLCVSAIAAVAATLVIGCGVADLIEDESFDPGFDADNILVARVVLKDPGAAPELKDRLEAQPGVQDVTYATALPSELGIYRDLTVEHDGQSGPATKTGYNVVDPDYMTVLGLPLLAGRGFHMDDSDSPAVAIVNETLTRNLWPVENPLGQRVDLGDGLFLTVVGVVGDERARGKDTPQARVYRPFMQQPSGELYFLVRTAVDPVALTENVQGTIEAFTGSELSVDTLEALLGI